MNSAAIRFAWEWIKPILPILVTLALFSAGAWALNHLLESVNFRDVIAQVRQTPWYLIGLALGATAIGYSALVGYDWSALRFIGKSLPLPVVFTGGFLAYALGNTIGAGPVTGGAVRYRIYAALGLTGYDIAAIAVFGSVAFGVGSTMIGFGALAIHPEAFVTVIALDVETLRLIGVASVTIASLSLVWLSRRKQGVVIRGRRFTPPSLGLMLGQLGFTSIDILMAASVLFMLLPPSELGFIPFLAIFSAAILAGVISHVPGGVGVFEAVIIAALPPEVPLDLAAAGLLMFRLIYFIVPFGLALTILSLSEIRMAGRIFQSPHLRVLAPVFGAVTAIVPLAIAAMIFASGVYMLLAALIPPTSGFVHEVEMWLPVALAESGALISSALGAGLIVIAHGLLRRLKGAYWLALAALLGGSIAALLSNLDLDRAFVLGMAALIMIPMRREFYRSTRLTRNAFSLSWVLLISSVIIACAGVYFFMHKAVDFTDDTFWQLAVDQSAPRAIRASVIGSLVVALFALIYVLRAPQVTTSLATIADLDRARSLIRMQDNPEANFALSGDKSILFSDSGRAFLMFSVQGQSWVALGDPVGDPTDAAQLAWSFSDAATAKNARAVFYETRANHLPLYIEMGFALHRMGEEAVVPLQEFNLSNPNFVGLNAELGKAENQGLSFEFCEGALEPAALEACHRISDEWLKEKDTQEKQFSIGRFDPDYLAHFPIALVKRNNEIIAFANVLTTDGQTKAAVDLVRCATDQPDHVLTYLIARLALHLKKQGYDELNLGMAPLAQLESQRGSRWTAKMGTAVFRHGIHFQSFKALRDFKEQFKPQWRARFLIASPRANMQTVATDAASLITGKKGRIFTPNNSAQSASDRE